MKKTALALALASAASLTMAADAGAGKAKAEAVCAACHGANGISVSDTIPNLAGQRAAYIEGQLKAFKGGIRKAPSATSPIATMAAIAMQLSDDDIANVDEALSLQGRLEKEDWVGQAQKLLAEQTAAEVPAEDAKA